VCWLWQNDLYDSDVVMTLSVLGIVVALGYHWRWEMDGSSA